MRYCLLVLRIREVREGLAVSGYSSTHITNTAGYSWYIFFLTTVPKPTSEDHTCSCPKGNGGSFASYPQSHSILAKVKRDKGLLRMA